MSLTGPKLTGILLHDMAYGRKYFLEFGDNKENVWRISVLKDGYVGSVIDVSATGSPLTISYKGGDLFDPVRGSEATISFLGYGIPPPTPSWGRMLSGAGLQYMLRAPWLALWPGLALAIVVYGINMLGDSVTANRSQSVFSPGDDGVLRLSQLTQPHNEEYRLTIGENLNGEK